MAPDGAAMPYQITGERLTSLFRPRSVAIEALDAVVAWKGQKR